jgi:hypothetical protein
MALSFGIGFTQKCTKNNSGFLFFSILKYHLKFSAMKNLLKKFYSKVEPACGKH